MAGQPLNFDNLNSLLQSKAAQQQLTKGFAELNAPSTQQAFDAAGLETGIAFGNVDPKTLTPAQTEELQNALTPAPTSGGIGGVLGGIGDVLGKAGGILSSNAGDFARDVEGIPEGLAGTVKAAYNTGQEIGGGTLAPGQQDLLGEVKGIAKGTVSDFTHFSPYHAVNPVLDVASLAAGGAGAAVKGASAVSRVAEEGGALSALAKPFAESSAAKTLSQMANPLSRPTVQFHPAAAEGLVEGAELPPLPDRYYSTSPARQIFLERPIDALLNSRLAKLQIPKMDEGTTLQDLQSNFYARRYGNQMRPQQNAVGATAKAAEPLVNASHDLLKEQGSLGKFNDAHDAAILTDQLGSWHKTPDERESALDQYVETVLSPQHHEGALNNTPEAQAIRDFRMKKYQSNAYRQLIRNPTEQMRKYVSVVHDTIHNEQKRLDIDPNEILQRSLGPAAHVFGKSTEELLRERPERDSMNFARTTADLDKAVRSGDPNAPELQYSSLVANQIPSPVSLAQKQSLVNDAIESLKADMSGSSHELLNNADNVGYLQGRTLAQKIATGMHDRLGVDNVTAENYMTGGMKNYYPLYSYARGHHVTFADNMIQRRLNNLKGMRNEKVLSAYRHSSPVRTTRTTDLGLSPVASFLKQSDLEAFRAGVDMREPSVMGNHIGQVERELVGRQLSSRMINDIAVKDKQGMPVLLDNDQERYDLFGSKIQADKYTTLPTNAIRQLFDSEGQAAQQLVGILQGAKGRELTADEYDQIQNISDSSAQEFVNQVIDEVNSGNKLVVLPKEFVNNLVNHAKILDRANGKGLLSKYQAFIHHWRSAVLSYMPAWLARTSIGHGIVLFLSGVGPMDYARASKFFDDESGGSRLGKVFSQGEHDVPVGINQGSMHEGLGATHGGPVSDVLLGNKFARTNTELVHNIANFQRRAGFLHSLNKVAKGRMGDLDDSFRFKYPDAFSNPNNIEDVIKNHPEMVRAAMNELHRVSYTFGQMSPWERKLAMNILPFWGWYKFISKFTWSLPITYPGRTLALTQVGQLGNNQFNKLGPIPDWLRNSILIDTHNLGALRYLPTTGFNPLADVINPAEGPESIIGLSQMSPVIQAGLEGYGINPLTGGEESIDPTSGIVNINGTWYNSHTGKSYDNIAEASLAADVQRMVGGLARSFPELNIIESIDTGGRSVYPESIPLIDEKVKGKTATKNVNPLGLLGQLGGVKPASYNEQQEQTYINEDLRRARSEVAKALATQR